MLTTARAFCVVPRSTRRRFLQSTPRRPPAKRCLYYGHGFEHGGQDANFLSYREFLESLRVPAGRAAEWRDFTAWFARPNQAFEEIRGVITADEAGPLTRGQYLALGIRQSIFAEADRGRLYDLYERY